MRVLAAVATLALLAPAAGAQHRHHAEHQHTSECHHDAPTHSDAHRATHGARTYGMPSADAPRHHDAPTFGQRGTRELVRSERVVRYYHGGEGARQHVSHHRTASHHGPPQWIRNEARSFRMVPAPRTARRAYRNGATYADGSRYTGALHGGLPHGQGMMTYADGSSYSGAFTRGMPNGAGIYRSAMGDVLTGTFQNGVLTSGQARYASGHSYSGAFLAGQPHGQGTMTYAGGSSYQGAFQSGRPDGWGAYRDAYGERFEGNWNRGQWADGPIYDEYPRERTTYPPRRRPIGRNWR